MQSRRLARMIFVCRAEGPRELSLYAEQKACENDLHMQSRRLVRMIFVCRAEGPRE
jgi:hypothetical protein